MTDDHVCDPSNPDCAAYLHYADPLNREPAVVPGSGVVMPPRRLGRGVTLTLRPEDAAVIKRAADFYGITFNEFIRRAARDKAHEPLVKLTYVNP